MAHCTVAGRSSSYLYMIQTHTVHQVETIEVGQVLGRQCRQRAKHNSHLYPRICTTAWRCISVALSLPLSIYTEMERETGMKMDILEEGGGGGAVTETASAEWRGNG